MTATYLSALERGCTQGSAAACVELAVAVREGDPPDPRRAAELLDRACSLGDAPACLELAGMLQTGLEIPRDQPRAARLRLRGCAIPLEQPGCPR
jgi:TPR repeat protein